MAGKIIADVIEAPYDRISLNVGNVTVLSANSTGLNFTSSGNVNINVTNSNAFTLANISSTTKMTVGRNITTASSNVANGVLVVEGQGDVPAVLIRTSDVSNYGYLAFEARNNAGTSSIIRGRIRGAVPDGFDQGGLVFETGANTSMTENFRIHHNGEIWANSGFGSTSVMYGVRAWVNFNAASGTPVIQKSGNVSSIGDRGAGQFTINFTTAMSDVNYAMVGSVESQTGWQGVTQFTDSGGGSPATATNKGTGSCQIVTTSGTPSDFAEISVIFVR